MLGIKLNHVSKMGPGFLNTSAVALYDIGEFGRNRRIMKRILHDDVTKRIFFRVTDHLWGEFSNW